MSRKITIDVDAGRRVSGLLDKPAKAWCVTVLAHGAGAGMAHPFMAAVAEGLAGRGIATLRYQFPYMEQGSKRPDARLALETHGNFLGVGTGMFAKAGDLVDESDRQRKK